MIFAPFQLLAKCPRKTARVHKQNLNWIRNTKQTKKYTVAVNTSSAFNCYTNRKENSCLHREHKLRNYKEKSKHAAIHDQSLRSLHSDFHPLETRVANQNRSCQPDCIRNPMGKQRTKKKGCETNWLDIQLSTQMPVATSVNECRCKQKAEGSGPIKLRKFLNEK